MKCPHSDCLKSDDNETCPRCEQEDVSPHEETTSESKKNRPWLSRLFSGSEDNYSESARVRATEAESSVAPRPSLDLKQFAADLSEVSGQIIEVPENDGPGLPAQDLDDLIAGMDEIEAVGSAESESQAAQDFHDLEEALGDLVAMPFSDEDDHESEYDEEPVGDDRREPELPDDDEPLFATAPAKPETEQTEADSAQGDDTEKPQEQPQEQDDVAQHLGGLDLFEEELPEQDETNTLEENTSPLDLDSEFSFDAERASEETDSEETAVEESRDEEARARRLEDLENSVLKNITEAREATESLHSEIAGEEGEIAGKQEELAEKEDELVRQEADEEAKEEVKTESEEQAQESTSSYTPLKAERTKALESATPEVAPEVLDLSENMDALEDTLDEMLGDEEINIEAVREEKPEPKKEEETTLFVDDLEISFEFDDEEEEEPEAEERQEEPQRAGPQSAGPSISLDSEEASLSSLLSEFEKLDADTQQKSIVSGTAFNDEALDEMASEDDALLGSLQSSLDESSEDLPPPTPQPLAPPEATSAQTMGTTDGGIDAAIINEMTMMLAEAYDIEKKDISPQDLVKMLREKSSDPLEALGREFDAEFEALKNEGNSFLSGEPLAQNEEEEEGSVAEEAEYANGSANQQDLSPTDIDDTLEEFEVADSEAEHTPDTDNDEEVTVEPTALDPDLAALEAELDNEIAALEEEGLAFHAAEESPGQISVEDEAQKEAVETEAIEQEAVEQEAAAQEGEEDAFADLDALAAELDNEIAALEEEGLAFHASEENPVETPREPEQELVEASSSSDTELNLGLDDLSAELDEQLAGLAEDGIRVFTSEEQLEEVLAGNAEPVAVEETSDHELADDELSDEELALLGDLDEGIHALLLEEEEQTQVEEENDAEPELEPEPQPPEAQTSAPTHDSVENFQVEMTGAFLASDIEQIIGASDSEPIEAPIEEDEAVAEQASPIDGMPLEVEMTGMFLKSDISKLLSELDEDEQSEASAESDTEEALSSSELDLPKEENEEPQDDLPGEKAIEVSDREPEEEPDGEPEEFTMEMTGAFLAADIEQIIAESDGDEVAAQSTEPSSDVLEADAEALEEAVAPPHDTTEGFNVEMTGAFLASDIERLITPETPALAELTPAMWQESSAELHSLTAHSNAIEIDVNEVCPFKQSDSALVLFNVVAEELVDPSRVREDTPLPTSEERTVEAAQLESAVEEFESDTIRYIAAKQKLEELRAKDLEEPPVLLASRGKRVIAFGLDLIAHAGIAVLLTWLLVFPEHLKDILLSGTMPPLFDFLPYVGDVALNFLGSWVVLQALLVSSNGQTFGGKLLGLEVVDFRGEGPSLHHALVRALAHFLTMLSFGLAALPAIGKKRRTLVDMMSMTQVTQKFEITILEEELPSDKPEHYQLDDLEE